MHFAHTRTHAITHYRKYDWKQIHIAVPSVSCEVITCGLLNLPTTKFHSKIYSVVCVCVRLSASKCACLFIYRRICLQGKDSCFTFTKQTPTLSNTHTSVLILI